MIVPAEYRDGVFRPLEPIDFAEGMRVELEIKPNEAEHADFARRLKGAKSLAEVFALYEAEATAPEGFDLCDALNETRRWEGRPPAYPDLELKPAS